MDASVTCDGLADFYGHYQKGIFNGILPINEIRCRGRLLNILHGICSEIEI